MGPTVLTSAEGLAVLKEKEEKKQKKAQEMEQCKQEGKIKKKERSRSKVKADGNALKRIHVMLVRKGQ